MSNSERFSDQERIDRFGVPDYVPLLPSSLIYEQRSP